MEGAQRAAAKSFRARGRRRSDSKPDGAWLQKQRFSLPDSAGDWTVQLLRRAGVADAIVVQLQGYRTDAGGVGNSQIGAIHLQRCSRVGGVGRRQLLPDGNRRRGAY